MTTDFTYGKKQIVSGGPFKPSGKDMPSDARTRVECYADIASIPNPHVGLKITVKVDETNNNKMTDYIVKSLKANSAGIANTLIDEVVRYVDYLGASSGGSVSQDDINTAVNNYLTEHPVTGGATAEQIAQIQANTTAIGDENSGLVKEVNNIKNTELQNLNTAIQTLETLVGLDETVGDKSGLPSGDANIIASINRIDKKSSGEGLTSEQIQQLSIAYEHSQSAHVTSDDLNTKVDKIDGKGLSTNDYTTNDKNTLSNLKTVVGNGTEGLVKDVNDIKQYGVSQDNINNAVSIYLADNPIVDNNLIERVTQLDSVRDILENPTKRCNIALLGDSITFGVGVDEGSGLSWADKIAKYINEEIPKIATYYLTKGSCKTHGKHLKDIYIKTGAVHVAGIGFFNDTLGTDETLDGSDYFELEFYGNNIDINYWAAYNGVIFDVYIDNVLHGKLNSTLEHPSPYSIRDLSTSKHLLKIVASECTRNKDLSGVITSVTIEREIRVENRAVSGEGSSSLIGNDTNFKEDDDIYFIMYGTNDRFRNSYYMDAALPYFQAVNKIRTINPEAKIIIMTPNPVSQPENTYSFEQHKVASALGIISNNLKTGFIDNFNYFVEYLDNKEVSLDSLLADGLHPNELGYNLYFRNILKNLHLSYPYNKNTTRILPNIVCDTNSLTLAVGEEKTININTTTEETATGNQRVFVRKNNNNISISKTEVTVYNKDISVTIKGEIIGESIITLTGFKNELIIPVRVIASDGNTYGDIVLSETTKSINEGESSTFSVVLDKAPTNEQVININVNNSNCTVNPTSLTFTSDNYNISQEVNISTISDNESYVNKNSIITLSSDNVSSKTVNVTIINTDEEPIGPTDISVTGITLSKETSTLTVGNSETLTYTITPSNATNQNVTWSVNNSNVSVTQTGVVTANSVGESIITVTTSDGNYSDSCTFTITESTSSSEARGLIIDGVSISNLETGYTNYSSDVYTMEVENIENGIRYGNPKAARIQGARIDMSSEFKAGKNYKIDFHIKYDATGFTFSDAQEKDIFIVNVTSDKWYGAYRSTIDWSTSLVSVKQTDGAVDKDVSMLVQITDDAIINSNAGLYFVSFKNEAGFYIELTNLKVTEIDR